MPNGRTSTSMEDPFNITAVPDDSVPKPADEDLPKVTKIYLHSCFLVGQIFLFQTNKNKNLIRKIVFMQPLEEVASGRRLM